MSTGLFLLVVTGGTVVMLGVVVTARTLDARAWRRSLRSYRLQLPSGLKPEQVTTWVGAVSALTHAPRGALLPAPPVVIEVSASRSGVQHRLLVPDKMAGAILASLRAALPGVRVEADTEQPLTPSAGVAVSLRLAGKSRQLAVDKAEAVSRALLAGMQPLVRDEWVCWQWIITGAGTPPPVKPPKNSRSASEHHLPWWLESTAPADADEVRSARLKQREPILHAAGRLLVGAPTHERRWALFGKLWGPVRLLNVPGARLVRSVWPSTWVRRQFARRSLPLLTWPLRLNAAELVGLLAFPLGDGLLPGVSAGMARQLPPVGPLPRDATVLADSNYPGHGERLGIARTDRLMHVWVGGPTGVGKSTLLANMAVQDIVRGDGVALIDPKGDLVADILDRVPAHRRGDVVVLDPADTARPVGLNVLTVSGDEADRELAVDHVLHVLKEQWPTFWGPRTDMVLRLALMALTHTKAGNGSAYTFCEIPELLTNQRFRRYVMGQAGLPDGVRSGLRWFDGLSDGERVQVVGPAMNKLSAFTHRTPLRLMLGQSVGVQLYRAMRQRKIVLVPLSRGRLGAETAGLLGSLLVTGLWQAALERVAVPREQRRPYWIYIDEAQEVVRLPLDLADMLAEARGLHVGLVLANQHLAQLPESVRRAVLSTVRSQVVFQTEPDDARVLARAFAPALDETDLRGLPAYEVAMRLCSGGQTQRPVTGLTRPLPEADGDADELRRFSRERYGTNRLDVEQAIRDRVELVDQAGGRRYGARRADGSEAAS